jgi:hypothetical protein
MGDEMPKNNGKPWAREEIKMLRQEARDRNVSTQEIAKHLGRTVSAVRQAAHYRGISLRPKNR